MSTAESSRVRRLTDVEGELQPLKEKPPYPKSVFFIVGNEFCERFSYYGMKTVLTIYLSSVLLYTEEDTKLIYHGFTMLCYFTPLLGAIVADSWLGRFKTIFYISIVYAIGNMTLSVGAFDFDLQTQIVLSLTGLGLIGLGTGGIKPCVAAFGADQFTGSQEVYLEKYFFIFYMCINAGATLSTALTPILRGIHCYGQDSCFPLAFGVPAVLMLIALSLFLMGSPFYRKNPPGDNVIVRLIGCISCAVANKFFSSAERREHWLDYADDKYDESFIEDVKAFCRVLVVFIPVPIFWALFDQQGSSWTLQATRMHWSIFGFEVLPEQIQLLNPIFMFALTPLFGYIVYPMLRRCNILTKPLQKIIVGGTIAAFAFLVCTFVQIAVEEQASNAMTLINTAPCSLNVTYTVDGALRTFHMANSEPVLRINTPYPKEIYILPLCSSLHQTKYKPDSSHRAPREKVIVSRGPQLEVVDIPELTRGTIADVKVLVRAGSPVNLTMINEGDRSVSLTEVHNDELVGLSFLRVGLDIDDGVEYTLVGSNVSCSPLTLHTGEAYTYLISEDRHSCWAGLTQASPSLSLLWQLPQYFLLTAGEVMFAVTGLEFSYSQAPNSMKSVVLSCWQMTVAIGNLLVVVVAKIGLQKQSTEFMIFALGMLVDMMLFAVLAYFYKPARSDNKKPSEKTPLIEESIRSFY